MAESDDARCGRRRRRRMQLGIPELGSLDDCGAPEHNGDDLDERTERSNLVEGDVAQRHQRPGRGVVSVHELVRRR